MTGSAEDGPAWQPHIRNKDKRRKLASRFKDSKDPFRIVIVRDMWLTGFADDVGRLLVSGNKLVDQFLASRG